ncbi:hypothetical protein XANCAGTX0491_009688 [Xanthoria calcicola]
MVARGTLLTWFRTNSYGGYAPQQGYGGQPPPQQYNQGQPGGPPPVVVVKEEKKKDRGCLAGWYVL